MMKERLYVLLTLLCLGPIAQAQIVSFVQGFTVAQANNNVYLAWTVEGGNTCNGITIFRSSDNITFQRIGDIAGICGSPSDPISYSYLDEDPEIGTRNYYKLELGSQGFSVTESVFVDGINSGELRIAPNPGTEDIRISFATVNNSVSQLEVINTHGEVMEEKSSSDGFFILSKTVLSSGIFIAKVILNEGQEVLIGKFVIP